MKALMGIILGLSFGAAVHIAASHYWRPLLPWKAGNLDAASWWHSPVSWLALCLLIVGAVTLLVLTIWAMSDSSATTGGGLRASLGLVFLPYTTGVLLYALISASPIRAADGLPGMDAQASTTSPRDSSVPRSGSPAMELKVGSVADAEAGLARVREHLRNKLTPALSRLSSDVADVKTQLKRIGVLTSADLKGNTRARVLAQELAEAIRFRDAVAASLDVHKNAEFELDSLLRRLKRFELVTNAGVPEGEFLKMNATLRVLDGQIAEKAGQPKELSTTELDELVDKELAPKAANDAETVAATHN